jgi:hypothetical protein
MLGLPFRYFLKHPVITMKYLAADPVQTCMVIRDYYSSEKERRRPQCPYVCDAEWERTMHEALGLAGFGTTWPCEAAAEFWELWPQVIVELEAKGINPGPASFQWWNDGDAGFVRAVWCMVRHLKPKKVVETGVAHGVTSRFILEALERNGNGGRLWSIDLPPVETEWRARTGAAVPAELEGQWTYIPGSSRRKLPKLLAGLGEIDLFIHDSLHSERNVMFELQRAWAAMPKGAVVVDDVDANWGFRSFTEAVKNQKAVVGRAEPLRPDLRCENTVGMFGVILKQPDA